MGVFFIIYFFYVWRFTTCTVQSKHKIPCLSPVTQNKKRFHAHTAVLTTEEAEIAQSVQQVGSGRGSRGSIPSRG
jgi:hypothetical protein